MGEPQVAEGREHIEQWNEDEPEYRMSLGSTDLGGKIDGDNLEPARETMGDELMDLYQIHRARMDMEPGCPPGSWPSDNAGKPGRNRTD